MDQRLRRTERLQRASDFRRVFDTGRVAHGRCVRIHYAPGAADLSRVGLVVTRKMGKAVVRNRIKRLLRETFRTRKGALPRRLDVVLVARGGVSSLADYLEAFERFLAQASREGERAGGAPRGPAGRPGAGAPAVAPTVAPAVAPAREGSPPGPARLARRDSTVAAARDELS